MDRGKGIPKDRDEDLVWVTFFFSHYPPSYLPRLILLLILHNLYRFFGAGRFLCHSPFPNVLFLFHFFFFDDSDPITVVSGALSNKWRACARPCLTGFTSTSTQPHNHTLLHSYDNSCWHEQQTLSLTKLSLPRRRTHTSLPPPGRTRRHLHRDLRQYLNCLIQTFTACAGL